MNISREFLFFSSSLGFAFIQHPSLMFEQEVKNLYNNILSDKNSSVNLKIQVLKNLQTYLQEEDTRMQQADRDCKWKYIFKVHSGAAVSILCDSFLIQIPTYPILDKGVELKKILHKLPKVVYKWMCMQTLTFWQRERDCTFSSCSPRGL